MSQWKIQFTLEPNKCPSSCSQLYSFGNIQNFILFFRTSSSTLTTSTSSTKPTWVAASCLTWRISSRLTSKISTRPWTRSGAATTGEFWCSRKTIPRPCTKGSLESLKWNSQIKMLWTQGKLVLRFYSSWFCAIWIIKLWTNGHNLEQ